MAKSMPSDLTAEKLVIGSILKSANDFWTVSEKLRASQFTDPIHREIFAAVKEICETGQPLSLTMVAGKLPDEDADGIPFRSHLAALFENAQQVNAADFADSIVDAWARRQLLEISSHITKAVKAQEQHPTDIITDLEARVADLGGNSIPDAPVSLRAIVERVLQNTSKAHQQDDFVTGYSTGLPTLDERLGPIRNGRLYLIGGDEKSGKGQPLDAKVLTPFGFREMGSLKVGSLVTAPDGSACNVIGIYPLGERQIYRVSFRDGTSTEVTEDHLWLAWRTDRPTKRNGAIIKGAASARLYTTEQIIKAISVKTKRTFQIPVTQPVPFTMAGGYERCPLNPYVLGVLLGDGGLSGSTIRITSVDEEIIRRVESLLGRRLYGPETSGGARAPTYGVPAEVIHKPIRDLKLAGLKSGEKFIPRRYLFSGVEDRWELLRGLMDTDGWVEKKGDVCLSTKSPQLADDVAWLARSLGAFVTRRQKKAAYKKNGIRFDCGIHHVVRMMFADARMAFALSRKRLKCIPGKRMYRSILKIEPSRIAQAQCIKVSHPSSLYITDDFIVTHNTALATQILARLAQYGPCLMAQGEMAEDEIGIRSLAGASGVAANQIETGELNFAEYEQLVDAKEKLPLDKLEIWECGEVKISQLRHRCLAMKAKKGLSALMVDHLLQVQPDKEYENEFRGIAKVVRGLKAIARDLDIPVFCLVHRTRSSRDRQDPTPFATDFYGGGELERACDALLAIFSRHRWLLLRKPDRGGEDAISKWQQQLSEAAGKVQVALLVHRHASFPHIMELRYNGPLTRFEEV